MSLHTSSDTNAEISAETMRVARASFPKGSLAITMRDVLGPIYAEERFRPLLAMTGRPAEAPWRLALGV